MHANILYICIYSANNSIAFLNCNYFSLSLSLSQGDEADVTVDYNLEEDDEKWMRSNQYFTHDKEIVRHFTADAFESIINILERHTGFSQEVVPQVCLCLCLRFKGLFLYTGGILFHVE